MEKIKLLLSGKCPDCNLSLKELDINCKGYPSKRVICLNCKLMGDGYTYGEAYNNIIKEIENKNVRANENKGEWKCF